MGMNVEGAGCGCGCVVKGGRRGCGCLGVVWCGVCVEGGREAQTAGKGAGPS